MIFYLYKHTIHPKRVVSFCTLLSQIGINICLYCVCSNPCFFVWYLGISKVIVHLLIFSHLINQLILIKLTTQNITKIQCKTSSVNSGQILQGKREQIESDHGISLWYILVGVVLNTSPRLHLAHIFPCGATFPKIWTYSLYHSVCRESPFPFNHSSF